MVGLTRALVLFTLGVSGVMGIDDWHFEWPSATQQCQSATVTITGGVPPWNLQLIPIGQQPIYWQFSAPPHPVNASYPATATIPLQLEAGTPYVVAVSDAEGWNTALSNPSNIQIVQPSNDRSCFAAANPAKKDFDFQVYGGVAQCERTFGVTWTTTVGVPPYYCTVIPLDSSYNPWDVVLAEDGSAADNAFWRVNMTSGTRFTVVMHDGYGLGRGGVGQIYEVQTTSNLTCVTQTYNGRSNWPAGLQVSSISPTSSAFPAPTDLTSATGTATQTASLSPSTSASAGGAGSSSSSSGGGESLGSGAIAGIAVGAAAVAIIAIGLLVWYMRRKRRNTGRISDNTDLLGGGGGGLGGANIEPKVEPYRPVGESTTVPTMGYGQDQMGYADQHWHGGGIESPGVSGYGAAAAVGILVGAAGAGSSSERHTSLPPTGKGGYPSGVPTVQSTSPSTTSPPLGSSSSQYFGVPGSTTGSPSLDTKVGYQPGQFSAATSPTSAHPLPPIPSGPPLARSPSPEFRRHTDGGEIAQQQQPQHVREIVDLPPLYEHVPSRPNQTDQR